MKCNKCGNIVFNSNAYYEISKIETPQQELVDTLLKELKLAKTKYGKNSYEVQYIKNKLEIEKRILETIWRCKHAMF